MSGVVAKMFVQHRQQSSFDGPVLYTLGVVCRNDENKEWSAATPSGTAVLMGNPVLDQAFLDRREVLVRQLLDDDGAWSMKSCDFTYNGCKVVFTMSPPPNGPYGCKLELTINAAPATELLRKAYAEGLLAGISPNFTIEVVPA